MRVFQLFLIVLLATILSACGSGSDSSSDSSDEAATDPAGDDDEMDEAEMVQAMLERLPEEFRGETEMALRSCDPLDTAHCLYPFPNNHFTREVADHQIGGLERGGTGRRVNLNLLAMPRNIAGKPIDPLEWNRNDGFSPGQLLMAFVPDLGVETDSAGQPTGPVINAPPINDIGQYQAPETAVVVIDTETGERHPIWAEADTNAGMLFPPERDDFPNNVETAGDPQHALLVRPAVNFKEGRRYVVALRNLENSDGDSIAADDYFARCRDQGPDGFSLPGLSDRCEQLHDDVFPVLSNEMTIEDNESLYLAWDFTVASTENNIGRLRHMRDDAFASLYGDGHFDVPLIGDVLDRILPDSGDSHPCLRHDDEAPCQAPEFTITNVTEETDDSQVNGQRFRIIDGTFKAPSYVLLPEPSPLEGLDFIGDLLTGIVDTVDNRLLSDVVNACQENAPAEEVCLPLEAVRDVVGEGPGAIEIVEGVTLPPNRLFYNPLDELQWDDPGMLLFGNNLPNRTGTKTVPFTCRLYEESTAETPARAGVYGHGLFDQRGAIRYDAVPDVSTFDPDNPFMFCAVDWFGFATGDLVNVFAALPDLTFFPVIPDATQQGMIHKMFLARLMRHQDGFASHEAFQDDGAPRFDREDVFYHGISQGGILGGTLVAMSQDITRGVLGVPGQSYSLLLRRSTGWSRPALADEVPLAFSTLMYLSYQDDLDRNLAFGLMQMLWDRGENNGYSQHLADNKALGGPDNQVMLRPAYADHLVTHWSAHNLARTIDASSDHPFLADLYPRLMSECPEGFEENCFQNRNQWHDNRDTDAELLFDMPLAGVDASYDSPSSGASAQSGLIQWDEGETAIPPIGNFPADWKDDNDPHGYPRSAFGALCQQSHFLHSDGGLIDITGLRNFGGEELAGCPALP